MKIMIDSIADLLESKYINQSMGKKMGDFIQKKHRRGKYKKLSYETFGKQLKKDFREVSNDSHMNAFYSIKKEKLKETKLSKKLDDYGESSNFGYVETRITKDNIGYLKIGHFTKWDFFEEAKLASTNSIKMLQNTNALIIDVRDNPGGFEDIVAHLISHFYGGEPDVLQSYYCRYQDHKRSIRTNPKLHIEKLTNIPIYILINDNTWSAGESFAYMMKHLNRATIIGEKTGGAGNGSKYFRVSKKFVIQVSTVETINAVTQTSWEKVGVHPDISTSSEDAYDKAMELAKKTGKQFHKQKVQNYELVLEKLERTLTSHSEEIGNDSLIFYLTECQKLGFYSESDYNSLGYKYLEQKSKTAEIIFKVNTLLYPNSANVYDSYAEVLTKNGKPKKALSNFEKAVALAKENLDQDLKFFIENLEKHKKQMRSKN